MGDAEGLVLPERFELVSELGAGGMGIVYQAYDREFGKQVAVKVFVDRSPATFDRVKREFRVAASVRHPSLVRLGELFEHDGSLCFSMEYVEGVELMRWIEYSDRFPRAQAALLQLAGALAALHQAGVVHRDVKPANVLVTIDDRVVLLDLGLAVPIAGPAPELAGTVDYVAPESARGALPRPPADLYALGVTAFELLTGRVPFEGTPMEILVTKCERDAPRVGSLVRGVPAMLDHLVAQLLARDPQQRPTAREVMATLSEVTEPARRTRRVTLRPTRDLVGRKDELAALLAASEGVGHERTILYVVRGPAGVGKSAVLEVFAAAAAARGHLVAMGRCAPREHLRYNAWDALIDALATYLAGMPEDERAAVVPEDAPALSRLFPSFERVAEVMGVSADSAEEVVATAVSALRTVLRRIARSRRVVSILDDAHWATDESFELLVETLRAPSPPCLVVFCVRTSNNQPRAAMERMARLRELPIDLRLLDVRPLSDDDAVTIATRLTGDATIGRRIGLAAGGNPLFIQQLAADPHTTATDIHELLRQHVTRLPGDHVAVLRLLAAAGDTLRQEVVGHALAMGHDTLAAILERLADLGLVRVAGLTRQAGCELAHDGVERAVRAASGDDLTASHRALAMTLIELDHDPARAVVHWIGAGEHERAYEDAIAVADAARDVIGKRRAALLCEQVLGGVAPPTGRLRLLRTLADALAGSGAAERAADVYAEASELATGDDRLDLERWAAEHYLRTGRLDDGMRFAQRVGAELGIDVTASHARILSRVVVERARLRWRGPDLARKPSAVHARRADACLSLAAGLMMIDNARSAWPISRAVRHALDSGDPARAARALAIDAALIASRGPRRAARVRDTMARARVFAGDSGDPQLAPLLELSAAVVALLGNDYQGLQYHADRGAAGFRTAVAGVAFDQHTAEFFSIVSRYWLGRWGEAASRTRALLRVADATGDRFARLCVKTGASAIGDIISGTPPDVLHAEVADAMRGWPRERAPTSFLRSIVADSMIDRYHGLDRALLERIDQAMPFLERTRVIKVVQIHSTLLSLRGAAFLGAGRFDAARDDARTLSGLPNMEGPAALIEAGAIAATGGDPRAALDRGIDACERVGFAAYAVAGRARRARVVGGDRGAGERLAAIAAAARLELGDAERAFDYLVPWPR